MEVIIVKEAYFKQVISDINHLCYSIKNNNTQSSAQDLDSIMASKEEQILNGVNRYHFKYHLCNDGFW